jgi:hypothetical protein
MTKTNSGVMWARRGCVLIAASALAGCVDDAASGGTSEASAALVAGGETSNPRTEFPTDVTIAVDGDDCPIPFNSAPSGDFEAITLRFSETMLWPEQRSVHCRIGIDYTFPAGWRMWRPELQARGVRMLSDAGQSVAWGQRIRIDGGAWTDDASVAQGPVNDDLALFVASGEDGGESPTGCDATTAHIDIELFGGLFLAGAPSDTTLSTVDSLDTEIDWERCN